MSLLQELHAGHMAMLKDTNSSEEQLTEFLDRNNCLLSDVLYREEIYNRYIEFLKNYENTASGDYLKILHDDKFIKISGSGYTPAVFWLSNFGKTVNCYNPALGGTFTHDKTPAEIADHIAAMASEGLKITVIDLDKI